MHPSASHYRLIERLGSGGMGEVWKAEDLKLRRTVAIKFVTQRIIEAPESKERITHEARTAAVINHPNIATVYEIGEDADRLFVAMEYIEGQTLRSRIEQGPFDLTDALDVAIQMADALSAVHTRGLIHCDIKDSNVMVTPDGVAKILDFGLAKTRADLSTTPSRAGKEPAGTLHYLAPEQIRSELVNGQTDLFSLGVVLYQMLTGRLPFDGDGPASVLKEILDAEPRPIGAYRDDVPLELEDAVRKALEKDRNERYGTAEAMRAKLKAVRASLETGAFPIASEAATSVSDEEREERWSRRLEFVVWRFRNWTAAAGAILLLAAAADFLFVRRDAGWGRDLTLSVCAMLCFAAAYTARRRRPMGPTRSRSSGAAFRGLLPFQETDRDRFYGRELETAALFDLITNNEFRFGVLFGDSGSGKTSLLRAGLTPRLWEEGFVPIYCRSYTDPITTLVEQCRRQSQLAPLEQEEHVDYLKRVTDELNAGLVVFFDQFEEFFVNFRTRLEREPFISFIASCHYNRSLPVKFLFSMRSDCLYLIGAGFDGRIDEPLLSSRRYHLRNLDRQQAAGIIERSVGRAGLPFAPGLSRHIAGDLAVNDSVLPSELQIVGEQLQNRRIFTLEEYRRVGGKEQLVHSYLEDVIQAAGDQDTARLLLRSLISDDNTRLTLTLDEITRRTQRAGKELESLLKAFAQARLVREIQDEEPWRYELMHEYLIEKINQVTGRVLDATQRANRLLRQYLSDYSLDKGTRVPVSKLWFIRRYADTASVERARDLLRKSLRWGLVRVCLMTLLLLSVTTFAAGALSVSETWEGVRLNGGHTAAARKIAFSPDGRLLVSVGEDSKVIVWDFARRERLATFTDHTDWVISVAFSPDGKWFATASDDQTVIVWDGLRLEKVVTLNDHKSEVRAVAFSPDGRFLASCSKDPDLRTLVWEVGSWKKAYELPQGTSWENFVFSSDSRYLTYADGETWEVATGKKTTGTFEAPFGGTNVALSADETLMVSIDGLGYTAFFEVPSHKLIRSYRAHQFHGRASAFSPDDRLVATAAEDIVLWDAATQTKRARMTHDREVWGLAFSPDGKWLVSSHEDGALMLWDAAEREPVANFNEHSAAVRSLAFSPDGKRLASASEDRSIIVWLVESGEKEATLIEHDTRVTALTFSPDGNQLASADQDGVTILWDIDRRQPLWKFDGTYFDDFYQRRERGPAYCLAFSPDGRFIATSLGVLDSAAGRLLIETDNVVAVAKSQGLTSPDSPASIYGAAFSPGSERVAFAMTDARFIYVLDTEAWQLVDSFEFGSALPHSLRFSPDGNYVAAGELGGAVLLLETSPLRELAVLGRHSARVKSIDFSPDGKRIVSSSDDQTIAMWDVRGRRMIARIGTHTAPVISVAFSPDGTRLASGEQDKSVRIYTRNRTLWGYNLD